MKIPSLVGPDGKTSLREYAGYHGGGGGFGGQLRGWNPPSESADAALLPNYSRGNARADDLVRNNGYAANAVQLHQDHIVGSFFRLSYRPSWRYLGINEEDSRAFSRDVEAAWNEYAEDDFCGIDAERKRTFTMMIREGVAMHAFNGELCTQATWDSDSTRLFRTQFKMVSPKRVSNPNNIGDTEVSSATAWTHTFTNTQLSAIRLRLKWPSLFKQEDDGDLVGYSINYAIDLQTDGGTWQTVLNTSVTGKTTSGYERSHRIDLPQAGSTWTVRLRKLTADANSAKIGDTMTLQSYTEVIDAKLRYPNTALLYIEFDSSQFNGSIPQISCEPRGRVIRVPDTYDPETRTYSGTWTGAFKWAWTDNPAWIFYDLVVSDRFGLGDRLTAANIDKWTLYQVAQYCDQLVPDGKGGIPTGCEVRPASMFPISPMQSWRT